MAIVVIKKIIIIIKKKPCNPTNPIMFTEMAESFLCRACEPYKGTAEHSICDEGWLEISGMMLP